MMTTLRRGQRLATQGYADILAALRHRPVPSSTIAATIGVSRTTANEVLKRMVSLGIAHISDWRASPKGPSQPVYAFGPGTPAPYPGKKAWARCDARLHFRPDLMAFANCVLAMLDGPTTRQDLSDLSGLSKSTLSNLLKHCRALKLVRVADWFHSAGPVAAMYAIGSSPDTPRPAPETKAAHWKRYDQKRRSRQALLRLIPSLTRASERPTPQP
jgi:lambda repressor-like predicted transcriptional regulator